MLKILLYNQNIEQLKALCNNIINSFDNLQIVGIATNENDLDSLINQLTVDIIIFDNNIANKSEILKKLNNFTVKIIFHDGLKKVKSTKTILYINKNDSLTIIKEKLSKFLYKLDERNTYQKVQKILKKMNFNIKLNGSFYLIHCICYSYFNKDKFVSDNLEKNVYPIIAKQFNVKTSTVKWSIIRAFNDVNINYCNMYSAGIYPDKVTPKSFINEIINYLD